MTPESFMKLEYQHPPIKFYWNIVLLICFVLSIATFMVFPIVLYPCENWTIKKSEHQRTDAFKLWCWRRLLRVPWTARRSNQSWEFIGRTDVEAETPILWLMQTADSFEETLMLGKIEGRRRRGWQRTRWLDGITNSMDISLSKFLEMAKDRETWCAALHRLTRSRTQLSDWTTNSNFYSAAVELSNWTETKWPIKSKMFTV